MHPHYQWFDMKQPRTRHFWRKIRLIFLRHPGFSIAALTIALFFLYLVYQLFVHSPHSHDEYDAQLEKLVLSDKCSTMSSETQVVFEAFVRRIVSTLEMLDVTNFLCYETLWSVLRRDNAVPKNRSLRISEACLNLCVLNEDLTNHDESIIFRRFENNGISVRYIHADGLYTLKPNTRLYDKKGEETSKKPMNPDFFNIHARMHVFERDSVQQDMYRRVGWRSRLLPSTMCTRLHCFPASLVGGRPLPKVNLVSNLEVNVPREGIEIQKYHYPDSWWTIASSSQDDCLY